MKTPSNNPNLLQLLSWISNFGSFTAAATSVNNGMLYRGNFHNGRWSNHFAKPQAVREFLALGLIRRVPTSFTWNITEYLHIHVYLCTDLWLNSDMIRKIYTNQVSSPIFPSWNVICSLNHTGFGSSHAPSVHPLPTAGLVGVTCQVQPICHRYNIFKWLICL